MDDAIVLHNQYGMLVGDVLQNVVRHGNYLCSEGFLTSYISLSWLLHVYLVTAEMLNQPSTGSWTKNKSRIRELGFHWVVAMSIRVKSKFLHNSPCEQHSHIAVFSQNSQKNSTKILYANIDWDCVGIPKWCIVGYSVACSIEWLLFTFIISLCIMTGWEKKIWEDN